MTIEEKLKSYIKTKYKSIRNFALTSGVGLPYTTIDGMLKRGINNTSIENVIKICKTLGISADSLADGLIVPLEDEAKNAIPDIEKMYRMYLSNADQKRIITLDDEPLSDADYMAFIDGMEILIEQIRKKRSRE